MTSPSDGDFPRFSTDVPTPARMYDYCLGGKDNFAVDRAAVRTVLQEFPDGLDTARTNRQFLYRAVRYLARDAGIRQYLDMGSGLPTENNVHQVAQGFQPDARVAYVDNDPVVLTHGRALLARDRSTTVVAADMTRPEDILDHPQIRALIDFDEPVAVLLLSVGHSIVDDAVLKHLIDTVRDRLAPGSYLAYTQLVGIDQKAVDENNRLSAEKLGIPWRCRLAEDVRALLAGLEPVEPGLVDINRWRPDPDQPPLAPVDEPLRPYIGWSAKEQRFMEFGGVLRRP